MQPCPTYVLSSSLVSIGMLLRTEAKGNASIYLNADLVILCDRENKALFTTDSNISLSSDLHYSKICVWGNLFIGRPEAEMSSCLTEGSYLLDYYNDLRPLRHKDYIRKISSEI